MNYYCHSCGAKNPYINGLKPKFCTNCGAASDVVAKAATKTVPVLSMRFTGPSHETQKQGSWRDEWKGNSLSVGSDDDIDLNEVMRGLKQDNGVTIEKVKMLTVADLKELESFDGRGDAPQTSKDMASVRGEIMKNLGVTPNQ